MSWFELYQQSKAKRWAEYQKPAIPATTKLVLSKCNELCKSLETLFDGFDDYHIKSPRNLTFIPTLRSVKMTLEKWRLDVHLEYDGKTSRSPLEDSDQEVIDACDDVLSLALWDAARLRNPDTDYWVKYRGDADPEATARNLEELPTNLTVLKRMILPHFWEVTPKVLLQDSYPPAADGGLNVYNP